ncbi:MAG TPA: hypothetical protein VGU26_01480 [Gaiellaceae bacterium]|nr:hypothetical protein [Gaiellaceae bacterium]
MLTGCSAIALASCGGSAEQKATPPQPPKPRIAAGVASPLAARSDKVATLLEAGDACGAHREAAALRGELTQAINADAIPELYLEDLSALVNEIQAQIPPCTQPPPGDEADHDEDKGKGEGKKRKKDKKHDGKKGDD